jgi:hypothetical protein
MDLRNIWQIVKGRQLQRCPDCDESIDSDAINIKEGIALCPKCGMLSRLSDLNYSARSIQEILSQPPDGCSIQPVGLGVIATASLRSIAGFLGAAAFALFWNGIVSVFVLIALAGLYANLIGPLPAWFPAPGLKEGKPEMNGEAMGLGMTLFLCVFLIPFVTVGVGMTVAAIINLVGKVEVVIDELDSWVATGIWVFKWKRRFDPRRVHAISYGTAAWQSDGATNRVIELAADRTIKFGSLLQSDRMEWLKAVLNDLLLRGDRKPNRSTLPQLTWVAQHAERESARTNR